MSLVDTVDDMDIVDNHSNDIVVHYVVGVMPIGILYLPELRNMLQV